MFFCPCKLLFKQSKVIKTIKTNIRETEAEGQNINSRDRLIPWEEVWEQHLEISYEVAKTAQE